MQVLHKLSLLAITGLTLVTIIGCADTRSDRQKALDESLAKVEELKSKTNWQQPAGPAASTPAPPADPNAPVDPNVAAGGTFVVQVESSAGDFTIEVHRDWAPLGAERFYQLVKSGFYDECRFFRVVPNFMVQFGINGDPAKQREWDKEINDDPVKQSNQRGYVTFAKTGLPNSRTTQIFISYADNSFLDDQGFAPFGHVTAGLKNVDKINPKHGESPQQDMITSSGNAYLNRAFPDLDYVKKMTIVSETPPSLPNPPHDLQHPGKAP